MRFFNIFSSEIKYQLKSTVFWIFIVATCLFAYFQFNEVYERIEPSQPDSGLIFKYNQTGGLELIESGEVNSSPVKKSAQSMSLEELEIVESLVDNSLTLEEEKAEIKRHLSQDLWRGKYLNYSFFINKEVRLSDDQRQIMEEFLDKIDHLSEEKFLLEVNQLDRLLGKNTIYGDKLRQEFLNKPLTPEEEEALFKFKVYKEGMTNAYGRLFADYLGITAGLFPIFIAAFLLLRDQRFQMDELVRVRQFHPLSYIWAKYLAVVFLISGAYLLIAGYPTFRFYQICQANGWVFHIFGFFKYTVAWVIPTMMFTVALGLFIGQMTGSSLIALIVQMILWFSNITTLQGNYSLSRFVIRFNSSDDYHLLVKSLKDIWINRIFFIILTIVCVCLVALIWYNRSFKGRSKQHVGKNWSVKI